MIGSILCYVLFPLSRLICRLTGKLQKYDDSEDGSPPLLADRRGVQGSLLSQEEKALLQKWPGGRSVGQQGKLGDTVTVGQQLEPETVPTESSGQDSKRQEDLDRSAQSEQSAEKGSVVLDLEKSLSAPPAKGAEGMGDRFLAGWHFSTALGDREVVDYPSWQFQGMSYSPPAEMAPLEVAWREWEDLSGSHSQGLLPQSQESEEQFEFTIMSYNILSQDLLEVNADLYAHCPLEILTWDFRLNNILQELQKWEPDILCLQEAQENHFREQLEPFLSSMGYDCAYKRRTGSKTDGCAVCYQRTKFSVVSVSLLEYFRPDTELLDRDNVGLVVLLQPMMTERLAGGGQRSKVGPICIANTHLLFNPRRGDVKLTQLSIMMAEIDRMIDPWQEQGRSCPVLLCGDFNSVPNMPLYQFIRTGQLHYQGLPTWMISGQEDCSYKPYQRKLYAPLWPNRLGITDSCRYVTQCEKNKSDKLRYSHPFMLQFRYCQIACQRPHDLELIQGVTDAKPELPENWSQYTSVEHRLDSESYFPRFSNTIRHGLNLTSVYSHYFSDTGRPEVTTLHSGFGATVDYIFYTAEPVSNGQQGGRRLLQDGPLKLLGRLSLLSEEDLWAMKGLPNEIYSSDHICLLAKFRLDTSYF
ncbi:protein angel-like protein 1-like [Huso huso]|uniref:Protein angel-like protein 1-like n=1 Tax=Huso huso TaxID=61971 RepID=A0ABR0Z2S6_HUSHU